MLEPLPTEPFGHLVVEHPVDESDVETEQALAAADRSPSALLAPFWAATSGSLQGATPTVTPVTPPVSSPAE